ncbi:MAG: twin-arginine translocase TatA/TatE family subunit [Chloroflexi bacterium]|nr:twin-arginine translocase TatA/TatE family subunit [Chloroflexota bacterium]
MDLFGIGVPEMIVICLVVVLVAGPRRSAIWAREIGRYMRQFREYVSTLMKEFEDEIGPDGKEFVDAAREIRNTASEVRNLTRPGQQLSSLTRLVEDMEPINKKPEKKPELPADDGNKAYEGWTKRAEDETRDEG